VTQKNPPPPPSKSIVESIVMPPEDWEDETISKIMLVTLDVPPPFVEESNLLA
jgi:hypothetical protein